MEFERLNPKDLKQVYETSKKYRLIFGGRPWNEIGRGQGCRKFYDLVPGQRCPCGCGKLEEAYPLIKTTGYIRDEISKPNAIAIVAKENGEIVAFGWGYEETGKGFAESKYDEEKNQDLVAKLVGENQKVFYMSEFGVLPERQADRNEKIGSQITLKVANEASNLGNPLLLRTMKSKPENPSRMDGIAKNKLCMKPIMGSPNTPADPENPERILYYKE